MSPQDKQQELIEALSTLMSASDVRRGQWQHVADGLDPAECIDELSECDQAEAHNMAQLIADAWQTVREHRDALRLQAVPLLPGLVYDYDGMGETIAFAESLGYDSDACEKAMIDERNRALGTALDWDDLPGHEQDSITDAAEQDALDYIRAKGYTITGLEQ